MPKFGRKNFDFQLRYKVNIYTRMNGWIERTSIGFILPLHHIEAHWTAYQPGCLFCVIKQTKTADKCWRHSVVVRRKMQVNGLGPRTSHFIPYARILRSYDDEREKMHKPIHFNITFTNPSVVRSRIHNSTHIWCEWFHSIEARRIYYLNGLRTHKTKNMVAKEWADAPKCKRNRDRETSTVCLCGFVHARERSQFKQKSSTLKHTHTEHTHTLTSRPLLSQCPLTIYSHKTSNIPFSHILLL